MDDRHCKILTSGTARLRQTLTVNDSVLAYLTSCLLLNEEDVVSVKRSDSGQQRLAADKVSQLLGKVRRGGKNAFAELCRALDQSGLAGNFQVATMLRQADIGEGELVAASQHANPGLSADCARMDSHMRCIEPYQRKDLLDRANAWRNHRRSKEVRSKSGKPIRVPRPLQKVVITTICPDIPEEQMTSLGEEIVCVGDLVHMVRTCSWKRSDVHESKQALVKATAPVLLEPHAHHGWTKPEPCFVHISHIHSEPNSEGIKQVESYLRSLDIIDGKTTVMRRTCHMPIPVFALHGGDKLHSYKGQGSVLVKIETDITEHRYYKTIEDRFLDNLKALLSGEEPFLQASHRHDDGRVLLVEMSAASLELLYRFSVQQPGILASIGVVSVATVDGSTVLAIQSPEQEALLQPSPAEARIIEDFISMQLKDISEAEKHVILQQPTYQLAVRVYSELTLDQPGYAKKILEASETAAKAHRTYDQRINLLEMAAERRKSSVCNGAAKSKPFIYTCKLSEDTGDADGISGTAQDKNAERRMKLTDRRYFIPVDETYASKRLGQIVEESDASKPSMVAVQAEDYADRQNASSLKEDVAAAVDVDTKVRSSGLKPVMGSFWYGDRKSPADEGPVARRLITRPCS